MALEGGARVADDQPFVQGHLHHLLQRCEDAVAGPLGTHRPLVQQAAHIPNGVVLHAQVAEHADDPFDLPVVVFGQRSTFRLTWLASRRLVTTVERRFDETKRRALSEFLSESLGQLKAATAGGLSAAWL